MNSEIAHEDVLAGASFIPQKLFNYVPDMRTIPLFIEALKGTYDAITVENIAGWLQHAGYA